MEEVPTTTIPGETAAKPMSFTEKLTNVFAAPGDLYDNVRDTPKNAANWIVPLLVAIVLAFAMSQVIMTNPTLSDQIKAMTQASIDKRIQESIQSGKMTPEQADQARAQAEAFSDPTSPLAMVFRVLGILIAMPAILFIMSLIYWLMGKSIMKAQAPYMKVVEVVGLVFFIFALESIVGTILAIAMKNIYASPSLALAVLSDFSHENKLHQLLAKINVFTIWELIVISIGLSRLFRRDLPKVMVLVFAFWVIYLAATIGLSIQLG